MRKIAILLICLFLVACQSSKVKGYMEVTFAVNEEDSFGLFATISTAPALQMGFADAQDPAAGLSNPHRRTMDWFGRCVPSWTKMTIMSASDGMPGPHS